MRCCKCGRLVDFSFSVWRDFERGTQRIRDARLQSVESMRPIDCTLTGCVPFIHTDFELNGAST